MALVNTFTVEYAVRFYLEHRWPDAIFSVSLFKDSVRYGYVLVIRFKKKSGGTAQEVRTENYLSDIEDFRIPDELLATLMLMLG